MKEKLKEIIKSYLIGLTFSLLVSGAISVHAATYFPSNNTIYDNTESQMDANNVQDALDELYNICS